MAIGNSVEIHTSTQFERILKFHELLKKKRRDDRKGWAEYLGVTTRTLSRDIKFMTKALQLPLKFDREKGAYIYHGDVPEMLNLPTTESELFAVAVAHKAIAQYEGTSFEGPLKTAFAKLMSRLDSESGMTIEGWAGMLSFQPFATNDSNPEEFEILTYAIRQHRVVDFEYCGQKDSSSRRREVEPHHLFYKLGGWYLLAFDRQRGQIMKSFALCRMQDVTKTPGKSFTPQDYDIREHLQKSFGVGGGDKAIKVVIEFRKSVATLIRERIWHGSQQLEDLKNGGVRLTMEISDLGFVASWILGWGADAKVLQPVRLRQSVQRKAKATARLYGSK